MEFNHIDKLNNNELNVHIDNFKSILNSKMSSLTNLLKNEDIKIILQNLIEYPTYDKQLILPRDKSIFGFESYIGMAYDYALRFLLSYQNNRKIDDALYDSIGYNMERNKNQLLKEYKDKEKNNKLLAIVDLSFKLSLNEVLFRSGIKKDIKDFSKENLSNIYNEIVKLLKVSFDEIQKNKESKINFNPVFGYGNILADGDIILNDVLVDFKAVSSTKNFNEHINQLIMYSILNQYNQKLEINYIQMYFPRYNDFPIYKIDDMISKKNQGLLKKIIYCDFKK